MRGIIAVLAVIMLAAAAGAQDTVWTRTYGHVSASELGLCGNVCTDGGYIAGGVSYYFSGLNGEFWLVRTNSDGDTIWTRNYGGDRWQEAHQVVETYDGGFAICGGYSVAVGDDDMFIVRTNASGDTLWTRRFGAAGEDDDGWAIIQTSDSGFVAAGHDHIGNNIQLFMVRLNADGDTLWTKHHGGAYSDYGYGVVETADHGFALTGTYSTGTGASDLWLLRTDANGDTLWTKKFNFHADLDRGDGIVLAPDGGFAIGGRTWSGGEPNLLALRTDSLGNFMWSREFGTVAGSEFAESIDIMPDGGFVIGGGAGPSPFDYYIARVNSAGDSLWALRLDGPAGGQSDDCYEIRVDPDGYIMAFGYTDISATGYDSEYWVVKIRDTTLVQPGYLVGQVVEDDGTTPISDVEVSVYDLFNSLIDISVTNIDGEFDFTLDPDTYYAVFSKPNYSETTLTDIGIVTSETTTVNVIMHAAGFAYFPGDVNMYNGGWPPAPVVGADATYLINFFRGFATSHACFMNNPDAPVLWPNGQPGQYFWASADVNGDCQVIGADVTKLINYLRGTTTLSWCVEYEPVWHNAGELPVEAPPGWPNCE